MDENFEDGLEPECPFGYLIIQRINQMKEEREEMQQQVRKVYQSLVENGFFEDVRNLQDSMRAIKEKREREEKRSWLWDRDWKIVLLSAIAGGLFNTILGSVILAALGIL